MNNYFHINTPFFSAWQRYGWEKNCWGIGLEKKKVDDLASKDKTALIRYGKDSNLYHIKAKDVQKYPVEQVKTYNTFVYIVPKTALKYKQEKSISDMSEKELLTMVMS